jgi:hypothetical protein
LANFCPRKKKYGKLAIPPAKFHKIIFVVKANQISLEFASPFAISFCK